VVNGFPGNFNPKRKEDSDKLNRWIEENIINEIKDQAKYPKSDLNVMRWVRGYTYLPDTQKAADLMPDNEALKLEKNREQIQKVFKINGSNELYNLLDNALSSMNVLRCY